MERNYRSNTATVSTHSTITSVPHLKTFIIAADLLDKILYWLIDILCSLTQLDDYCNVFKCHVLKWLNFNLRPSYSLSEETKNITLTHHKSLESSLPNIYSKMLPVIFKSNYPPAYFTVILYQITSSVLHCILGDQVRYID